MSQQKHTFYPNLNGLRFLGALMVLVFHLFSLNREIWGDFKNHFVFKSAYSIVSKGHYGVTLFFVLSGFLLISILLNEVEHKGKINPFQFLMRRILRIWPLYFLLVVFGFLIFPSLPYGQGTDHFWLNHLLFLSNFDEIWNGANDSLNFLTISWSVSIEEQFYLGLILLLCLIPILRKGKGFQWIFIALIILTIVFRWNNTSDGRVLYFHTFSSIASLAIGGLMAVFVKKYAIHRYLISIRKIYILIVYFIGLSLIFAASLIYEGKFIAFENFFVSLFFAFVILEQVYATKSFYKIDKWRFFKKGGELTYAIYMVHCVFIFYCYHIFVDFGWTTHFLHFVLYFILVSTLTFIFAFLSMKYLEGPVLKLKSKFR